MTVLGEVLMIIGGASALLDMGMNGARHGGWYPWGLGMGFAGLLVAWVGG